MPGQLKISVDVVQTSLRAFQCLVNVSGGAGLDCPTVRLWQTAGISPMFTGSSQAQLDANGDGLAVFDNVVLSGPCTARLVADSTDSATPLHVDDVHITVISP